MASGDSVMDDDEPIDPKKLGEGTIVVSRCHMTLRKHKVVSLFTPTNLQGEYYKNWNSEIYQVILRYRVDNKVFRGI